MGFGRVQNVLIALIAVLSCGAFSLPVRSKELGEVGNTVLLPEKTMQAQSPPEDTSWIHISPSIKPAYVGIHGGTAPVTLLKGEDGSVYAITGQTGSDFIQAIRSGNSSSQQKNNVEISNEAKRSSLPQREKNNEDLSAENYFTTLINSSMQDLSVYDNWADSTQWLAILHANISHSRKKNSQEDEIIEPKPINYPDVEFKTGAEVQKIAKGTEEMQTFGFSDGDMPPASVLNGTNVARYAPLKLNDYRDVIGITVQ